MSQAASAEPAFIYCLHTKGKAGRLEQRTVGRKFRLWETALLEQVTLKKIIKTVVQSHPGSGGLLRESTLFG